MRGARPTLLACGVDAEARGHKQDAANEAADDGAHDDTDSIVFGPA